MKTIIIGGGRGCMSVLGLTTGSFLKELKLEILAVVDKNEEASGMVYAREIGLKTYSDLTEALSLPDIELIIELTGQDTFLQELYKIKKPQTKIIDHTFAHIFWDLVDAQERQKQQLEEQVRLRREIESADLKFKSFINSAQDWISIKDIEGSYVIVNPVTAEAFDLKPEDFIGKKPEDILPSKLVETVRKHDGIIRSTKQSLTFDELVTFHGHDHHFQMVRFPLTDYRDELIGTCTIGRDITREVRLQEQLVQTEKLAALGKLAAGVAHEINNPLTGILAYAEDMADEFKLENPLYTDLQVIIKETLRCREIVSNLLDFARQDTPKFELIDPNKIVEQTLLLVQRLPQFKDINLRTIKEKNIPFIESDPKQLQQVLLNFMINASDAMKSKGNITISTSYLTSLGKCLISVEDTGPGIPENLLDKIFEPFFSTKNTNGLGLAVSWGIIERHGGVIEVDTAESGGAIFRIILPVFN